MTLHIYFVPHVADFPVVADPIGHTHNAEKRFTQKTFHAARPVGFDHLEVSVRKQRKIQIVLFAEFAQQLLAICATSEDYGIQPVEFPLCVAKLGRFVGSTRRQSLGKEI